MQRLGEIAAAERAERFDLAAPPLIRFALVRLTAEEHRLVLTGHHILLDGWSLPVLVRELLTLYGHARQAEGGATTRAALPRPTPYRDYLAWIAAQDRAAGLAAWREALAGLRGADLSGAARAAPRTPAMPEQVALALSEELTAALSRQARAQGLTLNSYHPGRLGDPARPADRARRRGVRRHGGGPAAGDCRHRDHGGAVHQHPAAAGRAAARQAAGGADPRPAGPPVAADGAPASGAAEIQSLAGLGELFDTLTVFENYPVDHAALAAEAWRAAASPASPGHDATHYPLSLLAAPGERLRLRLDYRADLFDREQRRGASRSASSGC